MSASLTTKQLSQRWQVKTERIIRWIKSGELKGFSIGSSESTRPTFRIPLDSVIAFENRRSAAAPPRPPRRRKQPAEVTEFF